MSTKEFIFPQILNGQIQSFLPAMNQQINQKEINRPFSSDSNTTKTSKRSIQNAQVQNLKSFHYFKFFQGHFISAELFIINPKSVSQYKKAHFQKIIQFLQKQRIPHVYTLKEAQSHQDSYFNTQNCRYRVVIDLQNLTELIKRPDLISKIQEITVYNSGKVQGYQNFLECKRQVENIQKCTKISKMVQSLQGYIDAMTPYIKYYKRSLEDFSNQQPISQRILKKMMLPAYFSSNEMSHKTVYRAKLWAAIQSTHYSYQKEIRGSFQKYKSFIHRLKQTIKKQNFEKNDQQAFSSYISMDRSQNGYINKEQNMVTILGLYKKESFHYNVLNSMLRICRRISDFDVIALPYAETYRSIKYFYDKFVKLNKFTRPFMRVYRGCRLPDIQGMVKNGYYEILGFFSCSLDRQVVTRQFLKHDDSCLMIINIPQYKIPINSLEYDHGLIDYRWFECELKFKKLMERIVGKDLSHQQQVMLNSYTLLKLVDKKKQVINGRNIWVIQCELVSFNELCERAVALRKQLGLKQQEIMSIKQLGFLPIPPTNSNIGNDYKVNKNQLEEKQKQLVQVQRVLKNLSYFAQQMKRIRDKGDLYAEFGEIDNQQQYYKQILIHSEKQGMRLSPQQTQQITFKHLQAMMRCGKLQQAHKQLIHITNNYHKDKNDQGNSIIKLSNYTANVQQQIKDILRNSDDLLKLRDSLYEQVNRLSKNKERNLYQMAVTMFQLGEACYSANRLSQCVQRLKTTKQYIVDYSKQLGLMLESKTQGCFDFFGMLSKLVGLKQQQSLKQLPPQQIKKKSLQLMQLQMRLNSLLIKCLGELVDEMEEGTSCDIKMNKYNNSNTNNNTNNSNNNNTNNNNKNNNKNSNRNNVSHDKLRHRLIQETTYFSNKYKQQFGINDKDMSLEMLVMEANLILENNYGDEEMYKLGKVLQQFQIKRDQLIRHNPNDERLVDIYHQLATIQAQQLSITISKPSSKFTIESNHQQKKYRSSIMYLDDQINLTNTSKSFNSHQYQRVKQKIQQNYRRSLQVMQVNGQSNTVKYLKIQNELAFFYHNHNMLNQSHKMAYTVTQSVFGNSHSQGAIAHLLLAKNFVSRGQYKKAQQQLLIAQSVLYRAIVKPIYQSITKLIYQKEYKHSQTYFQIEMLRALIFNSIGQYNGTMQKIKTIEQLFITKQTAKRLSNMMIINQTKANMLVLGYRQLPKELSIIDWQDYYLKAIKLAQQYLGEEHVKIGDYYSSLVKFLVGEVKKQENKKISLEQLQSYVEKAVQVHSKLAFDHPSNCNIFYVLYLYIDMKSELQKKGLSKQKRIWNIQQIFRYCLRLTESRYKQKVHINLIKTKYEWFRYNCQLVDGSSNNEKKKKYLELAMQIGNEMDEILLHNESVREFISKRGQLIDCQNKKDELIKQLKSTDEKIGIKILLDQKMVSLYNNKSQ